MTTDTSKLCPKEHLTSKDDRSIFRWLLSFLAIACLWTSPAHAEDRLWVEATINGRPVRLVFDTGASHLVLFKNAAERLGLGPPKMPVKFSPSAGAVPLGKYEPCELAFWGQTFKVEMGAIDVPAYLRSHADGVLAWGTLQENIFQMDVSQHSLALVERVPGSATNWVKLKLRPDSNILILEAVAGRNTNSIVVDTGFEEGVALSAKKWKEWRTSHSRQPATMNAGFMAGTGLTVKEEVWADEITLGPLHLTDVPVTEATFSHEAFGAPGFEAAIGMGALKRMEMIVDGVHRVAYINLKSGKPGPYDHNRLGAVFVPGSVQTNDLVAHVALGSPAEKAGIKNGDVLLKIDDLDATRWRTDPAVLPLSRFWSQSEGTRLRLTVRRENQTNAVNLKLENILSPKPAKPASATAE